MSSNDVFVTRVAVSSEYVDHKFNHLLNTLFEKCKTRIDIFTIYMFASMSSSDVLVKCVNALGSTQKDNFFKFLTYYLTNSQTYNETFTFVLTHVIKRCGGHSH